MSKFNVGDKVIFTNEIRHMKYPRFYPEKGTVGIIISVDEDKDFDVTEYKVRWEQGSTTENGGWWCEEEYLELYQHDKNKFCMLKKYIKDKDIYNAVNLAYEIGYESNDYKLNLFKETMKQKGYWEPVDINNLPKEGTKVRYSRECEDYSDNDEYICIDDTGVVKLKNSWFGMTLDNPHSYEWICFHGAEDCLDMWVEDNE